MSKVYTSYPKVEYSLTKKGKDLRSILDLMKEFSIKKNNETKKLLKLIKYLLQEKNYNIKIHNSYNSLNKHF